MNSLYPYPKDVKLVVILCRFYQRLKKSLLFRFLLIKIANIKSIIINQSINNLQNLVKQVINQGRADFVVITVEDWDKKKF